MPVVRLDSPPDVGKTGVVEPLAVQSLTLLLECCMVTTMTNEQACDVARRLASRHHRDVEAAGADRDHPDRAGTRVWLSAQMIVSPAWTKRSYWTWWQMPQLEENVRRKR